MFEIDDGREHFFQWDLNRRLLVEDDSITNIHFCNKTDDCALNVEVYKDGGKSYANVPNILLQDAWSIRAYAYCGECYTKQKAVYKVEARSKPADYVYTETEVKTWERLAADVEELVTEGRTIVNTAQEVAERTTELVNSIDNNIANALKGNKSGNPIALNDVSPIEHDIACKIESKNILPNFITDKTYTNGSWVKVNNDGSISVHKVVGDQINFTTIINLNTGYYTLSQGVKTSGTIYFQLQNIGTGAYIVTHSVDSVSKQLEKGEYKIFFYSAIEKETDVTLYPQLEKGTVATPYTPYIETVDGLEVKVYGKNLLSDAVYDINNWVREEGISINATNSKVYYLDEIPNGTYTISARASSENVYLYCFYSADNGETWLAHKGSNSSYYILAGKNTYAHIIEKTENTRFLIWQNNVTLASDIDYIQIEAGATATAYEPYIAPVTYTTDAEGNTSIPSTIDYMTLLADAGAIMDVKYNRDINALNTVLDLNAVEGKINAAKQENAAKIVSTTQIVNAHETRITAIESWMGRQNDIVITSKSNGTIEIPFGAYPNAYVLEIHGYESAYRDEMGYWQLVYNYPARITKDYGDTTLCSFDNIDFSKLADFGIQGNYIYFDGDKVYYKQVNKREYSDMYEPLEGERIVKTYYDTAAIVQLPIPILTDITSMFEDSPFINVAPQDSIAIEPMTTESHLYEIAVEAAGETGYVDTDFNMPFLKIAFEV